MDGDPTPGTFGGAPLQEVKTALHLVLGRVGPDIVVTLDGGGGHRDHRRIRAAVGNVLAETSTPVYLHTLPRSLMHRWVRHHAGDADATSYTELPERLRAAFLEREHLIRLQ